MTPVLEIRDLRKEYKRLTAVDDISFAIAEGLCFGLLGPNGAGKTTTIEMIEGITRPTSGEIFYKGRPRSRDFFLEAGIQFQATSVMDKLKTREILKLFHSLYSSTLPLEQLVGLCDLESLLEQEATRLSGGQKQRLMFALALINDPEIIFLDEPTTGLDPQSRRNLWHLIERIKEQGKTIILTTHYMDEAEILCDHLVIMDHGKIVEQGTPAALLREHFGYHYVCLDEADFAPAEHLFKEPVNRVNGKVEIQSRSVEQTLLQLVQSGVGMNSLRVRNPTLEDLFLKLTGHHLRD